MKVAITDRGFKIINFQDESNGNCSLQESSSVAPQIWLGVDNPTISVFEDDSLGKCVNIKAPKNIMVHSRLLLNRTMVADLLPHLKKFVKTGTL